MMNEITVDIPHTVILKLAENRLCSLSIRSDLFWNEKYSFTTFAMWKKVISL